MKIEPALLEEISQLAAVNLDECDKDSLLISLNSLMEDFSCLHDFVLLEEIQSTFAITLRPDISRPSIYLDYLHQNFPNLQNHLLIAPLINHEEM